ncbi:hypothetical protein CDL12_01269 [Handroanthus impetiginosus]|uniref:J domain-containing protein n=1 Tax=Handroanthus impetiginosus TaxID=429701 RepID=A0A2G9I8M6_9LAMI|nr:hypothetical protein CDL12_01269 [Handroanthus impetiginosus]
MEYSTGSPSYYGILGVSLCSSDEEIRRAYRKLAMQWHPDKWTRSPALLGEAKQKFQQIQEAYSVLSDRKKRTLYDAGLYNPAEEEEEEDEVEGFADFVQEMMSLVNDVRKEGKSYSIEELQRMFWDMAQGFEIPEWSSCSSLQVQQPMYDTQCFLGPCSLYESTNSCEVSMIQGNQNWSKPGFETYVTQHFLQ